MLFVEQRASLVLKYMVEVKAQESATSFVTHPQQD